MARPRIFRGWPADFPCVVDLAGFPGYYAEHHDGDTFYDWTFFRDDAVAYTAIRIAGVDMPELKTGAPGRQSAEWLHALLSSHPRHKQRNLYKTFERWASNVEVYGVGDLADYALEEQKHSLAVPWTRARVEAAYREHVGYGIARASMGSAEREGWDRLWATAETYGERR